MSQGAGDIEGPWNTGPLWERVDNRDQQAAVDGGDGVPSVKLLEKEIQVLRQSSARTASRRDVDPKTGAELGAGPGAGILEKEKAR
jgi:Mn-containing catalase